MTQRIFRSIFAVASAVLILSFVIIMGVFYRHFSAAQRERLQAEVSLAVQGVEMNGKLYLQEIETEDFRVTWIAEDGTVLFDTQIPAEQMENHGDREEIREAIESGMGESSRNSMTLTEKTVYFARRLSDGTVLRVSSSMATGLSVFVGVLPPLVFIFLLAVLLSIFLARRMTKKIMNPLNSLNLDEPLENNVYEELSPILGRISKQRKQIAEQQVFSEKSRREFTANVSHELKTPLQSIIGSAELMENGLVKQEDVPRFVGHIRSEASRMVTLIDDIIRLSQLDENTEIPVENVNLYEIALEVLDVLRVSAEKKNVTLSLKGESVTMNGVRRYLYEILYNLCDNAIRYNVEGGTVDVHISKDGGTAILEVKDTGIGISPKHQKRVFERFYRVDKSHSKETGGTGLGLSIVKHAVQYHGGQLEIESALEEGTTIRITF